MSKKTPTPKPTRLSLTMKDFCYFGKDRKAVNDELKKILESGHFLILEMTSSTSLAQALYNLHILTMTMNGVTMHYDYKVREQYSNRPAQVVVILKPDFDEVSE